MKNIFFISAIALSLPLAAQENISDTLAIRIKSEADAGNAKRAYEYAKILLKTSSPDIQPSQEAVNEAGMYMDKAVRMKYPKAMLETADKTISEKISENKFDIYAKSLLMLNELAAQKLSAEFTRKDLNRVFSLIGRAHEYGAGTAKSPAAAFKYYIIGAESDFDAAAGARRLIQFSGISDKNRLEICFFLTWKMNLLKPEGRFTKERVVAEVFENTRTNEWADARKNYLKYYCSYMERLAAAGDMDAIEYLAEAYSTKDGLLPQKKTAAAEYFIKSEMNGNREASLTLGDMRLTGYGAIQQDIDSAAAHYEKAMLSENKNTRIKAASFLKKYYADKKDKDKEFRAAMFAEDFIRANEIVAEDKDMDFSAMGLYLKAKEFQAENDLGTPRKLSSYVDRLRMAAGSGYPDAVIELAKYDRNFDKGKLIDALASLNLDDANVFLETAKLNAGIAALENGAKQKKAAKDALKYYTLAAERGNTEALRFFIKAYNSGNQALGIERDIKKLIETIKLTAMADYKSEFEDVMKNYISFAQKDTDFGKEAFETIRRASFRNAKAALFMAALYLYGSETIGIEKDPVAGIFYLSLAAADKTARTKLAEIYSNGIDGDISKDAALSGILSAEDAQ